MKLTRCDNHPDIKAVATFKIRELPAGSRPILIGLETGVSFIDLCDECADKVRVAKGKTDA